MENKIDKKQELLIRSLEKIYKGNVKALFVMSQVGNDLVFNIAGSNSKIIELLIETMLSTPALNPILKTAIKIFDHSTDMSKCKHFTDGRFCEECFTKNVDQYIESKRK